MQIKSPFRDIEIYPFLAKEGILIANITFYYRNIYQISIFFINFVVDNLVNMNNINNSSQRLNIITLPQLLERADAHDDSKVVSYKGTCILVNDINLSKSMGFGRLLFNPTRLEATVLIICQKGHIKVNCNLQDFVICEDSIFICPPGTIVQCLDIDEAVVSIMIATDKLFNHLNPRLIKLLPQFMNMSEHNHFHISHDDCQQLVHLVQAAKEVVMSEKNSIFYEEICDSVLMTLQYKWLSVLSQLHTLQSTDIQRLTRKEELFKNFISLVTAEFMRERSIKYYADKMCISPKYLGVIVKDVSGQNANTIIDHCVISEAKNLLKYSEMSIQQVSQHLNFSNQSFFGKYFKKHTGLSPMEFRSK